MVETRHEGICIRIVCSSPALLQLFLIFPDLYVVLRVR